ncbi:MAG TPA: hypothetical protein VJT31_16200 [Rugosimonospora sp.]|nr:hypothetical protein [Rugosimonospora sp.]
MTQTQQRAAVAAEAARTPAQARTRRAWWPWPAAFAAAWVVPVVCQLAGVDWLLPVLLLLATASLLRGPYLLDRLVVAFALLFGATCAAGLVLSVWPWRMSPVPVVGVGFTALIALAALLRRTPQLPARLRLVDSVPLLAAVSVWGVLWWPRRSGLFSARFAQASEGGDRGAHFMLYDTIRGIGGYVFQHRLASAAEIAPGYQVYPQGGHFVAALLQNFLSSTTHRPSAIASMAQFLRFDTATVMLVCAAMAWAVIRIAGPGVSMRLALPTAALAAGLFVFGDLETIIKSGFWAEQVCLGLLVVMFALLVRPLPATGEQIAALAALNVAIAYTYYFALPVTVGATLLWMLVYHRRIRRRWLLALGTTVVACVLGAIPILVNVAWIRANQGAAATLDATGALDPVGGGVPLALGGILVAGLLTGRRWWTPVTQMVGAVIGSCAFYLVAVGYFQWLTLLHTDYYYEKTLHVITIALVVMVGLALRRIAPALGRRAEPVLAWKNGSLRIRVLPVAAGLGLTLAMVEVFNPIQPLIPPAKAVTQPSRGRLYLTGQLVYEDSGAVLDVVARVPDPQRRATIVMPTFGGDPVLSSWVAVLERDYPRIQTWRWWADGPRPAPDKLVQFILAHPQPYQIVTTDPDQLAALRAMKVAHPDVDVQIVEFNPSRRYQTNW